MNHNEHMDTPPFPPLIHIETMNKCNLRCTMCPITLGQTNRPNMNMELYEKIIKECSTYTEHIKTLGLFLLNEPLLDPTLAEKISLAKKHGIRHVHISTNGELLSKERSSALIESGLNQIIISIESLSENIHQKIRVGSHLEKIIENVDNLIELKKKFISTSPWIVVRMLSFDENRLERKEFVNYWIEKGVDLVSIQPAHNWGGIFKKIHPELVGINICDYLWSMMVIQSDGNVCLCCLDSSGEFKLGNVKDQTLYDIWHGKKFEEIRKQFLEKKAPKCINCNWTPGRDTFGYTSKILN